MVTSRGNRSPSQIRLPPVWRFSQSIRPSTVTSISFMSPATARLVATIAPAIDRPDATGEGPMKVAVEQSRSRPILVPHRLT